MSQKKSQAKSLAVTTAEIKQRITPAQRSSWFLVVTSMLLIVWVGGSQPKPTPRRDGENAIHSFQLRAETLN